MIPHPTLFATLLAVGSTTATVLTAQDAPPPTAADPEIAARIAPLVRRAMERDLVPGLQVAVVTADGRRWSQGFGVADLETRREVHDDTRFYIASTTKALTALAAARLQVAGKVDLDASLARAFPDLEFPAGYSSDEVTVRDLLTHTHGLENRPVGVRISYTGDITNDIIRRMVPASQVRADRSFHYTNYGYDLFGLLIGPERVGQWKEVVEREVLRPLGMSHTTASPSTLAATALAMPHDLKADGMRRIRAIKSDANIGAAGGHFSTAADLGRLLIAELAGGRIDGQQVIEPEVIAETQRQQTKQDRRFVHYERYGWGLGWDLATFDGDRVIARSGGFSGYYSNMAFMPDHGFGLVVLTNGGRPGIRLAESVAAAIFDEMRGKRGAAGRLDEALDSLAGRCDQRRREIAARKPPALAPEPTGSWNAYAGTYISDLLGTIEIVRTEDGLELRMGCIVAPLHPLAGRKNAFLTSVLEEEDTALFEVDATGRPVRLTFRGVPAAFVRQ